jgi:hypothetical protein
VSKLLAANGQGLCAGREIAFRLPEPLLGFSLMLKLRTKVEIYSVS